jgi:hypothetical protein
MLLTFVGVSTLGPGLPAQAQDPHHPDHGAAAAPAATPEQGQGMMKQKMMNEMKAADAKLDALVQAMNAAKGAEKTDAIAAVVTALVEQHRSMHGSMMNMTGMMNKMGESSSPQENTPKP